VVVVMEDGASASQVERVAAQLAEMGYDVHRSTGPLRTSFSRSPSELRTPGIYPHASMIVSSTLTARHLHSAHLR
jgi:hypothetical protein